MLDRIGPVGLNNFHISSHLSGLNIDCSIFQQCYIATVPQSVDCIEVVIILCNKMSTWFANEQTSWNVVPEFRLKEDVHLGSHLRLSHLLSSLSMNLTRVTINRSSSWEQVGSGSVTFSAFP